MRSALGAPSPAARVEPRFREIRSHCLLDPRPRSSSASRCSREAPTSASLGQAAAQRLLQLHYRRTDTLPSIRFSPNGSSVPLARWTSNLPTRFAGPLVAQRPSPVEEGSRVLRAATVPSKPAVRRCKHAAKRDLDSCHPTTTPLAGDALVRPPFAAVAVG